MMIPTFLSALVRTVIVMTLSGSLLIVLLFCIKPLIRHRLPKSAQYGLWIIVLFALLIPVSRLTVLPGHVSNVAPIHSIVERNVLSTTEEAHRLAADYRTTMPPAEASESPVATYEATQQILALEVSPSLFARTSSIFMLVYPWVALLILLYSLLGYFRFIRKIRNSQMSLRSYEVAMLNFLSKGKIKPTLSISNCATTPMLIGIFKPQIVLPNRTYTSEQLYSILLHELTHMKRFDIAVKWLSLLACAMHWFNPLVWVARREIDRVCELSCDEAVIHNMDVQDKQSYGDTLIDLSSNTKIPLPVLSTTMHVEKRAIKERLTSIMKSKKYTKLTIIISLLVLLAAVLTACTLGGAGNSQSAEIRTQDANNTRAETNTPTAADIEHGRQLVEDFLVWFPSIFSFGIMDDIFPKIVTLGDDGISRLPDGTEIPRSEHGYAVRYQLYDLDNNGIPEVLITFGDHLDDVNILYQYQDGAFHPVIAPMYRLTNDPDFAQEGSLTWIFPGWPMFYTNDETGQLVLSINSPYREVHGHWYVTLHDGVMDFTEALWPDDIDAIITFDDPSMTDSLPDYIDNVDSPYAHPVAAYFGGTLTDARLIDMWHEMTYTIRRRLNIDPELFVWQFPPEPELTPQELEQQLQNEEYAREQFLQNLRDTRARHAGALEGPFVIRDGYLYLDPLVIIFETDDDRIAELGYNPFDEDDAWMKRGWTITSGPDPETMRFRLTDETIFNFFDLSWTIAAYPWTYSPEPEQPQVSVPFYVIRELEAQYNQRPQDDSDIIESLPLWWLFDESQIGLHLSPHRIPWFIQVEDGVVVSVTEEFFMTF